jgi:hypothetical protein
MQQDASHKDKVFSQFSKQSPQIIHDLDNVAQLLGCLLYSINDFGISLILFKIHLFIWYKESVIRQFKKELLRM